MPQKARLSAAKSNVKCHKKLAFVSKTNEKHTSLHLFPHSTPCENRLFTANVQLVASEGSHNVNIRSEYFTNRKTHTLKTHHCGSDAQQSICATTPYIVKLNRIWKVMVHHKRHSSRRGKGGLLTPIKMQTKGKNNDLPTHY